WLAYEPRVSADSNPKSKIQDSKSLDWLGEHAAGNPLIRDELVPRTMRRMVATGEPGDLAACIAFIGDGRDSAVRHRALQGLLLGLQDRHVDPPAEWKRVLPLLREDQDKEVQRLAGRLAVYFRDAQAVRRALAVAQDRKRSVAERVEAIHDLVQARAKAGQHPLEEVLRRDSNVDVRVEA